MISFFEYVQSKQRTSKCNILKYEPKVAMTFIILYSRISNMNKNDVFVHYRDQKIVVYWNLLEMLRTWH